MNYDKLGLKIGLEIHQQLDSGHKLFCNCPIKKMENFPIEIVRKLRPTSGELSLVDPAAIYEFLRNRKFKYKINKETTCLVETDEEPPMRINENAIYIVLQMCKLLNCDVVDEIYTMRKTIIDGSSVSGFQRTSLIGLNGFLESSVGEVKIHSVCLEEDSAPATKEKNSIEYRLDRMGTPLIEITTEADMHTPKDTKTVAEKIGMLLRSTNVIRGIGSIRQDVNISIANGPRVEIKGFQQLDQMEEMIDNEINRQIALNEIKDELFKRKAKIEKLFKDVTPLFSGTNCHFARNAIQDNGKVIAFKIPFAGLMNKPCGDKRFGQELASYASAYGYGITHSEENLEKYQLTQEFQELENILEINTNDVVVITVGKEPEKAILAVIERCEQCLRGIPEETRVSDGIGSKYTRPLAGADRMYPETDVMPFYITKKYLDSVHLPKTLDEKQRELEKEIPKDIAEQILRSNYFKLYEEIKNKIDIDPILIANTFTSILKDVKRKGLDTDRINKDDFFKIFASVKTCEISKDSIPSIIEDLTTDNVENVLNKYKKITDDDIRKLIRNKIIETKEKRESALMGIIMKEIRGKADGQTVLRLIKEELSK